jgi:hypothetical protein
MCSKTKSSRLEGMNLRPVDLHIGELRLPRTAVPRSISSARDDIISFVHAMNVANQFPVSS